MKKLSILLATIAIILAGCSKDDVSDETSQEPIAFEEGQKVTFTASVELPATRATTNFDGTSITTAWELNDVALLSVGGKSANFTVTSIDGSGNATLEGTMPASGTTFDLQYPATTPDLTTQQHTEGEALPKNKMLYKATGCSLSGTASLKNQNAVLNVNFKGVGTKVGKIMVKKAESTDTYTLNFTTSKQLSDSSTPLFMIMPTGTYKIKVEVYDDSATPQLITSFATSKEVTFSTETFLEMPAKEAKKHEYVDLGLSVKWATYNVGADKPEGYGDYFAWGETEPYYTTQDPLTWKTDKTGGYCWQSYCGNSSFTEWTTPRYDGTTKELTSTYDAATANWGSEWRMPTEYELRELTRNCKSEWTTEGSVAGVKFTSKKNGNSIFLPAAGYRDGVNSLQRAETYGYYWSTRLYTDGPSGAQRLVMNLYKSELTVQVNSGNRYYGQPVRPVKVEKQEHEYVDLGLSVIWATCNVGADSPEDYGDYFAWGETKPYYTTQSPLAWKDGKNGYNWQSYCGTSSFTEWTTLPYDATNKVLTSTYDAATANWGGGWRMPTKAEWEELSNADNFDWTWCPAGNADFNGKAGYKVTSKIYGYVGKFIFLPAAGYRYDKNLEGDDTYGDYWFSSLETIGSKDALCLSCDSVSHKIINIDRYLGMSVRPVR